MYMPMMPDAIEQAAPTRKAIPVRMPSSTPKMSVSATSGPSTMAMTRPITTAPPMASRPMVRYWRRMKATAPSKIVPAMSCIAVGAGIGAQDVPGEVEGEGDRGDTGDRDHPDDGLELHGSSECGRRPRESEGDDDRG